MNALPPPRFMNSSECWQILGTYQISKGARDPEEAKGWPQALGQGQLAWPRQVSSGKGSGSDLTLGSSEGLP